MHSFDLLYLGKGCGWFGYMTYLPPRTRTYIYLWEIYSSRDLDEYMYSINSRLLFFTAPISGYLLVTFHPSILFI